MLAEADRCWDRDDYRPREEHLSELRVPIVEVNIHLEVVQLRSSTELLRVDVGDRLVSWRGPTSIALNGASHSAPLTLRAPRRRFDRRQQ